MPNSASPIKKGPIYLLLNSLSAKRGGLTRNLLYRARLLSEASLQEIHILNFTYIADHNQLVADLQKAHLINDKIEILNFYEELAQLMGLPQEPVLQPLEHPVEEKGLVAETVDGKSAYRLYRNGLYIKYKNYDAEDRLQWIDYFNENRYRTKREVFDQSGRLRNIIYMDYHKNKPKQSRFFDERGHCYLSKWFNPEKGKCTRIHLFSAKNNRVEIFYSERDLKIYWLNYLANKNPYAIFQTENTHKEMTDDLLIGMNKEKVIKIKMVHSSHLNPPYEYHAPVIKAHQHFLQSSAQFDAIVFITEQQRQDVIRRFGPRTAFYAIPHCAPPVPDLPRVIEKDPWKVVSIGRFATVKNLDQTIQAFRQVVDQLPQATLELWGMGPEEAQLKTLVKKLGLTKNVFIKGFTDSALEIFQSAALSIFTSSSEGFGLVIAESMSVGTPVISYDINYGPREMIDHNENGLLVPPGKIETLAQSVIRLLENQQEREQMGEKAKNIVHKLNEKDYASQWLQVYEEAWLKYNSAIKIKNIDCNLEKIKWSDKKRGMIKLQGYVQNLSLAPEKDPSFTLSLYLHDQVEQVALEIPIELVWVDESSGRFSTTLSITDLLPKSKQNSVDKVWNLFVKSSTEQESFYLPLKERPIHPFESSRILLRHRLGIAKESDNMGVRLRLENYSRFLMKRFKEKVKNDYPWAKEIFKKRS